MLIGNFPRNIPLATLKTNGLMSSQDKQHLENFKDKVNSSGDIIGRKVYIFTDMDELKSTSNFNEGEVLYYLNLEKQCLELYLISTDSTPIVYDTNHPVIELNYSKDEHNQELYAKFIIETWNDVNLVIKAMNSGSSPENWFKWEVKSDGSIMITGPSNNMPNDIYNLVIPTIINNKLVTEIQGNAFNNCDKCTNIYLPDTISTIGNFAFANMPNLKFVKLSNKLTELPTSLFINSTLEHIDIPETVSYISNNVFYNTNLKKINIPVSVNTIGNAVFMDCKYLEEVYFYGNNGIVLDTNCFRNCPLLDKINLPKNCTIGNSAFRDSGCRELFIPENSKIKNGCFAGMKNLKTLIFDKNVSYTGDQSNLNTANKILFYGITGMDNLELVYIYSNMKKISEDDKKYGSTYYTKENNKYVQKINITTFNPNIEYYTYDETMLTITKDTSPVANKTYYTRNNIRVTHKNLLKFLDNKTYYEFHGSYTVTQDSTPQSSKKYYIHDIGNPNDSTDDIYIEYSNLKSFTTGVTYYELAGIFVETTDTVPNSGKTYYTLETNVLVSHSSINTFIDGEVYYEYTVQYTDTLMYYILENNNFVVEDEVVVEDKLSYILYNTNNTNNYKLTIRDGYLGLRGTTTEPYTYYLKDSINNKDIYDIDCLSINKKKNDIYTHLILPKKLKYINSCAFKNSGIGNVVAPDTLISIGEQAFMDSNLTYINLPNSLIEIKKEAFRTTLLKSLNIPSSLSNISEHLCHNCKQLSSINIPNSIEEIQEMAFCGCSNLTVIDIPQSVETIYQDAFRNCSSLSKIILYNGNLSKIYEGAFRNSSLLSVTIPESVDYVGESAFYSNRLEDVIILSNTRICNHDEENNGIDYRFIATADQLINKIKDENQCISVNNNDSTYMFIDSNNEIRMVSSFVAVNKGENGIYIYTKKNNGGYEQDPIIIPNNDSNMNEFKSNIYVIPATTHIYIKTKAVLNDLINDLDNKNYTLYRDDISFFERFPNGCIDITTLSNFKEITAVYIDNARISTLIRDINHDAADSLESIIENWYEHIDRTVG